MKNVCFIIFIGFCKIMIFIFFRSLYINLTVAPSRRGEYHCWLYKLLSGIVMLMLGCHIIFNIGVEGLELFENKLKVYLHVCEYSKGISEFTGFGIMTIGIIWFCKGIFRIGTFHYYDAVHESGSGLSLSGFFDSFSSPSTESFQSNIDRAISYRNSKLSQLSGMDSADLLVKTAVLDAAKNGSLGNNPDTQRAMSYLDSKLGGMSGFDGVDYLAGRNE